MKLSVFIAIALMGMAGTSAAVWSMTGDEEESSVGSKEAKQQLAQAQDPATPTEPAVDKSSFVAGDTLMMEGRLGHSVISSQRSSESFLFVDVNADATKEAKERAQLNLAIVIDRSGSMRGKRLKNAIEGAKTALAQLRDGDVVSVVTYSDRADVIVTPTIVSSSSRKIVEDSLKKIRARGETCISCGIDLARRMARANKDKVTRLVLLSDGEATVGIQDVGGFSRVAEDCRNNNMSITTIGVDVDYNERIMAALARVSNGRHHFVDRADQLASIFTREMESLSKTIATNAELTVDLQPGVFVDEVLDRSFERRGNRLIVPLGNFTQNDRKTLLVRLRVPQGPEGERPIADIKFRYDDLAEGKNGSCEGELIAMATADDTRTSELDGLVSGRLNLSETARSLEAANLAFASGDAEGAEDILRQQRQKTAKRKRAASRSVPKGRAMDLEKAFGKSSGVLDMADEAFTPAAAAGEAPAEEIRDSKAQIRSNQASAVELAL